MLRPPLSSRHAKPVPEGSAEVRRVVEAPSEGHFGNGRADVFRSRQVRSTVLQSQVPDVAVQCSALVGEDFVQVTFAVGEGGGNALDREVRIGDVAADVTFDPFTDRLTLAHRGVGGTGGSLGKCQLLGERQRNQLHQTEAETLRGGAVYRLHDKPENFRSVIYKGTGHEYLPEMKDEMVRWFERHLPVSR